MLEKNIRKIMLACIALLVGVMMFSFVGDNESEISDEDELGTMLCEIEGIEEVSIVYHYSTENNSELLDGIAVVYKGSDNSEVKGKIYELVNALYGIPYNRIYVSH